MEVIISNPEKFTQLKASIKLAGLSKLSIVADFDKTLTYANHNGISIPSIQALLRDGNHLSEDYAAKAHQLYDKYSPLEESHTISLTEKKLLMTEWWTKHFKLMIESGLNKSDLEDIVASGMVAAREGVTELLKITQDNGIPFIIMSASGCGEVIPMFMNKWFPQSRGHLHYLINRFSWDEQGNALAPRMPVIHSYNKDEAVLEETPEIWELVKNRSNLIILGDGIGDLGMAAAGRYENIIKVGFLNHKFTENIQVFKKAFDVVLAGDGDLNFVPNLLQELK